MYKLRDLFLTTLILFSLSADVFGQARSTKTAIAVLEFASSGDLSKNEIVTLTKRFRDMLVQTEVFNVLERDKMDAILKEQDFILSDNCNSAECAVQVGQLLGVEAVVTGDIGKIGDTWTVSLRLVDMTTGKIEGTQTMDYQGKIDGLLDVMRQIAFTFAGKVPPKEKTILIIQSEKKRRHAQGRFLIQTSTLMPVSESLVLWDKNWQDKPERVIYNQWGGKIAFMYQYTSHFRFGITGQIQTLMYKDTLGQWIKTDLAAPVLYSVGLCLGNHFQIAFLKPFFEGSAGLFFFQNNISGKRSPFTKKDIARIKNLKNETGLYGDAIGGMDLELYPFLDLRMAGYIIFARPKPLYFIFYPTVGLVFHAGKPFPESIKK